MMLNYVLMQRDPFFADDTCVDHYRTLGYHKSATAANNAATAICTNNMCMSRMDSYINNFDPNKYVSYIQCCSKTTSLSLLF